MNKSPADINRVMHMVKLQVEANDLIIGKDWMEPEAYPEVDFVTAMSYEGSELAGHLAYEWWKKTKEPDLKQAKLEVVDMLHFAISQCVFYCYGVINDHLEYVTKSAFRRQLAVQQATSTIFTGFGAEIISSENSTQLENLLSEVTRDQARKMVIASARKIVSLFDKESVVDGLDEDMDESVFYATYQNPSLVQGFNFLLGMSNMLQMSFDELYLLYVGKNVLNRFRKANGYKEGTYVKQWNGQEDNEVLHAYLSTLLKVDNLDETVDYEAVIYKHLERKYPKSQLMSDTPDCSKAASA